jgi:methionine-gamma-lyase
MTPHDPATRVVHHHTPPLTNSHPISVPLYQASNFGFDDPDALADALNAPDSGFAYSRYGNPTTRAMENAVAELEGGFGAVATASGMGAINSTLLGVLSTGDHVIAQSSLYGGTYAALNHLRDRLGVEVSFIPGADPAEVGAAVRPNTRLLYLETITNPVTRVVDLPAFLAAGKDSGLLTVVDNTFATPLLCRPIELGADIVLHSVTKYLGGHSDVVAGVQVFADEARYRAGWHHTMEFGASIDPFAAWLTLRGMQTLALRMRQHCDNAGRLAELLAAHPAVAAVHYPGLPANPDHEVAKRVLSGFGGVVSFDLAGGREAGNTLSKGIRLIKLAASLGGVETMLLHPASSSHRQLDADALRAAGISEGTIRLSVGIEHVDDIWADLAAALP